MNEQLTLFGFDPKPKKKYDWYEMVSAYHKELRLGNVANIKYWAHKLGYKKANNYLNSILLEETCNFELLKYCLEETNLSNKIRRFAGTKKNWEHKTNQLYIARCLLMIELKKQNAIESVYIDHDKHSAVNGVINHVLEKDFEGMCEDFYRIKWSSQKLKNKVFGNIIRHIYPELAWLFEKLNFGYHEHISFIRLNSGICDPKDYIIGYADDSNPGYTQDYEIPIYALDKHTSRGKRRINQNINKIRPNKKMPPGIDLRYSGTDISCIWRVMAFQQFGTINTSWENVVYHNTLYRKISQCS